jgi:hypothetical protein
MGSAFWFVRFRCSLDGVYFRYGLLVQSMSRLRLRPRGFIPDIAFGREPSNSTGGTFTRVDASFSSARPSSAVQKVLLLILNNLRCFSAVFLHYILHRFRTAWQT